MEIIITILPTNLISLDNFVTNVYKKNIFWSLDNKLSLNYIFITSWNITDSYHLQHK